MTLQTEVWKYPNLPPKPFQYPRIVSMLDSDRSDSALNNSFVRGFYNLAIIFLIIFFTTQPIVNFLQHGYWLDTTLYETVTQDFLFCLFTWPIFFLWSFTSFFLQKLIIFGMNIKIALILQHFTQIGLFAYSLFVIFRNNGCSTHSAFVVIQACAHFMKMHSYVTVNR